MELLKIRRNFQLTLPQSMRRQLKLHEGDFLQAAIEKGAIIIRPVEVVSDDKENKRAAAFSMLDQIWAKTKNEDPEAIECLVSEAVKAVRK
jgi:bifunctional DNA-binding transcriptional regulator/antitoxin component of YhaV-PrlF toxin-antitoxin module